jgi:hypothetical protein
MRNNDVFIAFILGLTLGIVVMRAVTDITYSGRGMYEYCSTKYSAFENRMVCVDLLEESIIVTEELDK